MGAVAIQGLEHCLYICVVLTNNDSKCLFLGKNKHPARHNTLGLFYAKCLYFVIIYWNSCREQGNLPAFQGTVSSCCTVIVHDSGLSVHVLLHCGHMHSLQLACRSTTATSQAALQQLVLVLCMCCAVEMSVKGFLWVLCMEKAECACDACIRTVLTNLGH